MSSPSIDQELIAQLIQIGESVFGDSPKGAEPVILSDRVDGVVVRVGDVVVKAHAEHADAAALLTRLRVAEALPGILLPPLRVPLAPSTASSEDPRRLSPDPGASGPVWRVCGRLVTVWPLGEPVSPEHPEAAPWEEAAILLARLHSTPPELSALPVMGGPGRVARAMERLRIAAGTSAAEAVQEAFAGLPVWARGVWPPPPHQKPGAGGLRSALVHGDWHFGQLVRRRAGPEGMDAPPGEVGDWRLIDVDDLGVGDPAWDLARPAAWYASGLLLPEEWMRFLSAYRAQGGCAIPAEGDPWPALDVPARALTVQSAALEVAAAEREGRPLDEVGEVLVETCRRISRVDALPNTP